MIYIQDRAAHNDFDLKGDLISNAIICNEPKYSAGDTIKMIIEHRIEQRAEMFVCSRNFSKSPPEQHYINRLIQDGILDANYRIIQRDLSPSIETSHKTFHYWTTTAMQIELLEHWQYGQNVLYDHQWKHARTIFCQEERVPYKCFLNDMDGWLKHNVLKRRQTREALPKS